jgi:predicted peptidase
VGAGLRYLLYRPASYESRAAWPLILFLHGGGERGENLELVKREGLPHILETRSEFPFVVVSPQETRRRRFDPETLSALLDEVGGALRIDRSRVSVTGLSSGATAALELAIRHPEKVAAVAVVSTGPIPEGLCGMKDVPLWIFHNARDTRIPVHRAKKLARDFESCGGEAKLTIFPTEGHDAWTEAYRQKDLYEWFLKKRRDGD